MAAAGGAAGAGAAAAAIAQAIKASGTLVSVEPEEFVAILSRSKAPLVIIGKGSWLQKAHQYLTSYKGLAFYAQSDLELPLPPDAEVVHAKHIWMPG